MNKLFILIKSLALISAFLVANSRNSGDIGKTRNVVSLAFLIQEIAEWYGKKYRIGGES